MNRNFTILHVGSRLYPPNLTDAVGLAEAQLMFNFQYIFPDFFSREPRLPSHIQIYGKQIQIMNEKYGKLEKLTSSQSTSFKLGEYIHPVF